MTQHERILDYMEKHGSITTIEAFFYLHITKLPTRVSEMIRDGRKIEKENVHQKNQRGEWETFTRYRLNGG